MVLLKTEPGFAGLHDQPRFRALLGRMAIP